MSVRAWAIKPGELKPLSAEARVAFLVRCSQRVEPWVPKRAKKSFREGLAALAAGRRDEVLATELQNLGAAASNALDGDPLGECHNYATLVLSSALLAETTKDIIEVAKFVGSIAAVLAHAGLTKEPLDVVAVEMWDSIRGDARVLADGGSLDDAPLWVKVPSWLPSR